MLSWFLFTTNLIFLEKKFMLIGMFVLFNSNSLIYLFYKSYFLCEKKKRKVYSPSDLSHNVQHSERVCVLIINTSRYWTKVSIHDIKYILQLCDFQFTQYRMNVNWLL